MAKWITACPKDNVPAGSKTCIDLAGMPVVLYNVEGELGAMVNVCPHAGLPLGDGEMVGRVLVCPFHGYSYDTRTGRNVDFDDVPATVLPVRVTDDGTVEVDVEPKSSG